MTPCNCHALRKATRRVTQLYDHTLMPSGLRATQFALLCVIEKLQPTSLLPLADSMVMDRATLGHNLRPLQAQGYLKLVVGQDRRSREVSLTKAGQKALEMAKPLWQQAQTVFEDEMSARTAKELRAVLQQVVERVTVDAE